MQIRTWWQGLGEKKRSDIVGWVLVTIGLFAGTFTLTMAMVVSDEEEGKQIILFLTGAYALIQAIRGAYILISERKETW